MKRFTLCLIFVAVGVKLTLAQTVQITGTVISSEDKQPLPGAAVIVKGTNIGTTADAQGKYSLNVPSDAKTLVFELVGMKKQEIDVAGRTIIDVTLDPETVGLNEVIVTALSIKRSERALGYSVSQVQSDDIEKSNTLSAINALEGKIAGVNISTASGASTKIILRGYSSIGSSNSPLFVIDGVPVDNGTTPESSNQIFGTNSTGGANGVDFGNRANDINPNDIASISILKGAAATVL